MRRRQAVRRQRALQGMENLEWRDVLGEALRAPSSQPQIHLTVPACQILGLYSAKLDWLAGALPFVSTATLGGRLSRHLDFLRTDDRELLEMAGKAGGVREVAAALSKEERVRMCEDRGLDVFDMREEEVRGMLVDYLSAAARRPGKA